MPRSQQRLRVALCTAVACAGLAFVAVRAYESHRLRRLEETCERIAHWAGEQPLEAGAYPRIVLSSSFALPAGSEVNLVKTAGGDIVVLLKTFIGWKSNYEGVLYSTRALGPEEVSTDYYGRDVVDIPDIEADPPVVRERINAQFLRVYFDLR